MTERPSLAVGLMSGTSLDGMDAALVRFTGPTRAELVAFAHRPYHAEERRELEEAIERQEGGARRLARLHALVADWAAEAVQAVLSDQGANGRQFQDLVSQGRRIGASQRT